MKCCLSNRQRAEYLQKADEIKVPYKDRKQIIDLLEKYKNADIIVDIPANEEIDWEFLSRMNVIGQNRLILSLRKLTNDIITECDKRKFRFYFCYPVSTFQEVEALTSLGACYVKISGPLIHQTNILKTYPIKKRIAPNIAYYKYIPDANGVCGQYIRPEDLDKYEDTISAIEFEGCDKKKEQALYRIYMEQKKWSGDLKDIITNLDYPGVNRMIPDDFANIRKNCGQKCYQGNHCNICYRYLNLADPDLLKSYAHSI